MVNGIRILKLLSIIGIISSALLGILLTLEIIESHEVLKALMQIWLVIIISTTASISILFLLKVGDKKEK